jgi:2-keto-4-pentenoate hydratase
MKRFNRVLFLAFVLLLLVLSASIVSAQSDWEAWGQKLYDALQANEPFPLITVEKPDLTLEESYEIQTAYSKLLLDGKEPAGFKAGLTAQALMEKFGSSEALAGILLPEGAVDYTGEPVVVKKADFRNLMLEIEIAYIMKEPLTGKVESVDALKGMIEAVAPAIELPDLSFADMSKLRAFDLNAAAVASKAYIIGKSVPLADAPDLNAIDAVLTLDGAEILRGKGSDTLGDQWETVLWLVNNMTSRGWTLKEGDVLISGALGSMVPGKPGSYVFTAGDLGTISFIVE